MTIVLRTLAVYLLLASEAAGKDLPGERVTLERKLAPQVASAALRELVEACVGKLGLVSSIQIEPVEDGTRISIDVRNTVEVTITGVVLKSDDYRIKAINELGVGLGDRQCPYSSSGP